MQTDGQATADVTVDDRMVSGASVRMVPGASVRSVRVSLSATGRLRAVVSPATAGTDEPGETRFTIGDKVAESSNCRAGVVPGKPQLHGRTDERGSFGPRDGHPTGPACQDTLDIVDRSGRPLDDSFFKLLVTGDHDVGAAAPPRHRLGTASAPLIQNRNPLLTG